jgi:hypothetical protein
MRFTLPFLASVFSISYAAAGCSPHLGEDTVGENGTMRFEYSTCLFGCSLEQNALQGSRVSIRVSGGNPDVAVVPRLTGTNIGAISSQMQSCSCQSSENGKSQSRTVQTSDTCTKTETKSCSLTLDIETKQAGDAKLEIIDGDGVVVDRVDVHVRPAARIDVTVRDRTAGEQGIYEVRAGEKLKIASKVLDADGREMIFAQHGVSQAYADASIVGPDESVLIGSTTVEDAIAKRPGETSLTTRAPGAETVVRFRVK